eukprot:GGOE01015497.1.p1 GENE.GGOE01015497.1~~GGOE01015497.1.p1  ORF type:complete len:756 (-),score=190.89 GGOE01015497.1:396-2663(-)
MSDASTPRAFQYVIENYQNATFNELQDACREQRAEAEACSRDLKDLIKEHLGAFVALQDQLNSMHQQPDLLFRGPPLASLKQAFAGLVRDGEAAFQPTFERSDKLATIKSALACLHRLKTFFEAPNAIRDCMATGDLDAVAHIYKRVKALMLQTRGEKTFQKVFQEVTHLVADVRHQLINQLNHQPVQSAVDLNRLLSLLHALDIAHNPALLYLNTRHQAIEALLQEADERYRQARVQLWFAESNCMAADRRQSHSVLESAPPSLPHATSPPVPEEELDKCCGAAAAAVEHIQSISRIVGIQLQEFWLLMGKEVVFEGRYRDMQEEDEDLASGVVQLADKAARAYATACGAALAVVERRGTGAEWVSSIGAILRLVDDAATWGCCEPFVAPLLTFGEDVQTVFYDKFLANLVQEIQGLQSQVVWRQEGFQGCHGGVKCTNLPAAFLAIVERSLLAWPQRASMEQDALPEIFETSLCVFVDVLMNLATQQEALIMTQSTKPGGKAGLVALLPTEPLNAAVVDDPCDRLLLLLADLLAFQRCTVTEVVELLRRFSQVPVTSNRGPAQGLELTVVSEVTTSAVDIICAKYISSRARPLISLIVEKGFVKPALSPTHVLTATLRPYALDLVLEVALTHERLQRFTGPYQKELSDIIVTGLMEAIVVCYLQCCETMELGPPTSTPARIGSLQLEMELDLLEHSVDGHHLSKPSWQRLRGVVRLACRVGEEEARARTLAKNQAVMAAQNCCKLLLVACRPP